MADPKDVRAALQEVIGTAMADAMIAAGEFFGIPIGGTQELTTASIKAASRFMDNPTPALVALLALLDSPTAESDPNEEHAQQIYLECLAVMRCRCGAETLAMSGGVVCRTSENMVTECDRAAPPYEGEPEDWPPEIRLNDDGTVDEIIASGLFHMEQLDDDVWWFSLYRDKGPSTEPRLTWTIQGKPPNIIERVVPAPPKTEDNG